VVVATTAANVAFGINLLFYWLLYPLIQTVLCDELQKYNYLPN